MLQRLRNAWYRHHLSDPAYAFLFDPPPPDEWVSIDCETTGLDRHKDHIISIGAVRIQGPTVRTSQRLEVLIQPAKGQHLTGESVRIHQLRQTDLWADGVPPLDAARQVLHFIGSRPLVGYYLEFDVALLNRLVRPLIGIPLPHVLHEVSGMYYDHKYQQHPGSHIDLRLAPMMVDLGLPQRRAHNAVNDATMAALAFVKLRHLRGWPAPQPQANGFKP
jgi:DNA polymerase-3 subunit epsilon